MAKVVRLYTKATETRDVVLISLSLVTFSLTVHLPFPFVLIAFVALVSVAWIVTMHQDILDRIGKEFQRDFTSGQMLLFNLIGLEFGILVAFYYRYSYSLSLFPHSVNWFFIAAIMIAVLEEVLFRGFLQSMVETKNHKSAAFAAAFVHAAYKSAIFLPLSDVHGANIPSLFFWSFIAFAGLGFLKQFSKSIAPPIIAHVIFDVIVYAEFAQAPWWVW